MSLAFEDIETTNGFLLHTANSLHFILNKFIALYGTGSSITFLTFIQNKFTSQYSRVESTYLNRPISFRHHEK